MKARSGLEVMISSSSAAWNFGGNHVSHAAVAGWLSRNWTSRFTEFSFNLNLKFSLFLYMCIFTSRLKFNIPQRNFCSDVLHKTEIGKHL